MLKSIDPLLGPDLLYVLQAMGHGDELTIVDANYPAQSAGPDARHLRSRGVLAYAGRRPSEPGRTDLR